MGVDDAADATIACGDVLLLMAREPLHDDVLVETGLLLELADDVPSCHSSTHIHCHAHTCEERRLHTDDVMRLLQMCVCMCACARNYKCEE